jgi:hypothetical protein
VSVWTHISGVVRFDTIRHIVTSASLEASKRIVSDGAPEGSEGGLDFVGWENPLREALSSFAVSFFGDLRDFGNEDIDDLVRKWLRDGIMARSRVARMAIRQMIVTAEVEDRGTYTWLAITDGDATLGVSLIESFWSADRPEAMPWYVIRPSSDV